MRCRAIPKHLITGNCKCFTSCHYAEGHYSCQLFKTLQHNSLSLYHAWVKCDNLRQCNRSEKLEQIWLIVHRISAHIAVCATLSDASTAQHINRIRLHISPNLLPQKLLSQHSFRKRLMTFFSFIRKYCQKAKIGICDY